MIVAAQRSAEAGAGAGAAPASAAGADRTLIFAPTGSDAALTRDFLHRAGLAAAICQNVPDLRAEIGRGCGVVLLAEEVLNAGSITEIVEALGRQPAWSDIPIVLISSVGNASRERLRRLASFGSGGTVTLLERPFRPGTLVATIEAALRARYRQYQVCRLLAEVQENARRSQLISETAAQLLLADSPQAEVPGIFQRLADELGAEYHLLHLLSPDGKVLVLAGAGGFGPAAGPFRELRRGDALCGGPAGRPPPAAFAAWAAAARVKAWNCQVLQVGERMLGTIVFASARRESLTAEELRAVRTICDLVAASLERMRLLEELGAARDAAERANRSKDDFLAALSHELRTPLSPVLLVATAAVNDPNLALAVRGDFELISRHIALEARLIDDLLDLTGITRGKLTLELRPLKLHEVLREAAATAETELRAKDIALRLEFAAEPAVISADPVRVRQVFWNVIKNAVKFTPPQGSILVTTERTSGGRSVRITIADTGVGMTPEEIERAFDAFSQGDHARSPSGHRFGGLGLGLAISRALVGLHGGTISARSAGRGRGSTFTVELPLVPAASAVAAAAEPVPDQPIGAAAPARILLVEDHEPTRQTLARLLGRRGYLTACAGTIAEAEALAAGGNFDLLISDLGLPDGSGYDLMARLRERRAIKGIALSGYGMEGDLSRSRKSGFAAHLVKPVSMQSLDAAVFQALASTGE